MSKSINMSIKEPSISTTKMSNDGLKIVSAAYAKLKSIKDQQTEPIAIVGMSGRFPKANDLSSFWHNLQNNVDAVSKTSNERYDIDSYYNESSDKNKILSPYSGYIDNAYDFDASFFDISPKEAIALDPQQRLLLETSVEALENANHPIDQLSQINTSVYIGISSFDYGARLQNQEDKIDTYLGTGTLLSPAAGRISYALNLNGPSMVIDTACSSSLVSIHQAIMSLRTRESDVSLVGGVGLILEPNLSICFSKAKMLSPDGKCKTFDAEANGYVRGEGCAVVVLKRLSDAISNKDNVLAIIRGSAVNQDGASGGLTIPSGPSQENVIKKALQNSNTSPQEVDYVEAHGTGTSLGDPIEVNALGTVFSDRKSNLKIGSVKTNIGHLEAASGLASLIKVVLAMQNEIIPASLHFKRPNPNVAWQDLPIEVISQNTPWPRGDKKRVAGLSAFGFSGTNTHVVVSESPSSTKKVQIKEQISDPSISSFTKTSQLNTSHILTISAKNKVSLLGYVKKLQRFLKDQPDPLESKNLNDKSILSTSTIGDICLTSNIGRTHYKERLSLVDETISGLKEKITKYITYIESNDSIDNNDRSSKTNLENNTFSNGIYISNTNEQDPKITFIFQGVDDLSAHDNGMLIYNHFKHQEYFQNIITQCRTLVIQKSWISEQEWDTVISNSFLSTEKNDTACRKVDIISLMTFCFQYALAKFLYYIGIKPKIVGGYGTGEYLAACVAGIFSLEDALFLLKNTITNPQRKEAKERLTEFSSLIQNIKLKKSLKLQFFGAVSNKYRSDNIEYWEKHFEYQVQTVSKGFASNELESLIKNIGNNSSYGYCLVIGNSSATKHKNSSLSSTSKIFQVSLPIVDQNFSNFGLSEFVLDTTNQKNSVNFLPYIIASLYSQGIDPYWNQYHHNTSNQKTSLPTYSWDRKKYMFNTKENTQDNYNNGFDTKYSVVQKIVKLPISDDKTILFDSYIDLNKLHYIKDHQIFDKVVFPESTFIEMLFEASDALCKNFIDQPNFVIEEMVLHQPYIFSDGQSRVNMQIVFKEISKSTYDVEIVSLDHSRKELESSNTLAEVLKYHSHISCKVNFVTKNPSLETKEQNLSEIQDKFGMSLNSEPSITQDSSSEINIDSYYQSFAETGVEYGPSFRSIKRATVLNSGEQVLGLIDAVHSNTTENKFCINPLIMDGCLQLISAVQGNQESDGTYFIMSVKSLSYYLSASTKVWCLITRLPNSQSDIFPTFDLEMFNENGSLVTKIESLQINRAGKDVFLSNQTSNWFYKMAWQEAKNIQNKSGDSNIALPFENVELIKSPGKWLILSNGDELTNKVKNLLNNYQQKCITVSVRNKTGEQLKSDYLIESISPDSFTNLFSSLQANEQNTDLVIKGVIYSWGMVEQLDDSIMNVSMDLCLGLLYTTQALSKLISSRTNVLLKTVPRLCVITNKAQLVNEQKNISTSQKSNDIDIRPQQSALWGMGRVIVLESPEFKPLFVDYDHITKSLESDILSDILFTDDENQIAYRDSQRHVLRLEYDHSTPRSASYRIESDSAYLITGGFGALGMQVAKRLVRSGARYLVLISRKGAASQKAKSFVKSLEDIGVTVQVCALDISKIGTNHSDLSKLIEINAPLRGIVHTAGVLDDKLLLQQTKESFTKVLAPKIQGTWNLHRLTENTPLDFFVCFSSMTSVIGAMGQVNYAAANSFMDVLCPYLRSKGIPAISISWGPWAEVGMGANEDLERIWSSMGITSIGLEEGMNVFERLLEVGSTHLGVMPTDWSKYQTENNFFNVLKQGKKQKQQNTSPNLLLDLKNVDQVRRKKMLVRYIESEVCKILGYEEGKSFEENQGFFELGMNSLTAVEFKNNLQSTLNCNLSSTITFDYPTIAKLSNYLDLEVVQDGDNGSTHHEKDMDEEIDDNMKNMNMDSMMEQLSKQLGM